MPELLAPLPAWPILAVASVIVLAASAVQAVLGVAAFFCIGCAISALGLARIGWLGGLEVLLALFIVPAMVAGTWLGCLFTISSTGVYRKALLCFAAGASFILVIQGTLGLLK